MTTDAPRVNAAEHAYRTIRARIVSGKLAEGERLTEKRLSKDLGISRTPVREAIGRLTIEGFVERQSGYDTRVAAFPPDEIEQIYELRRMLETYSVRRAATMASAETVAALKAIHERMKAHTPPRSEADYQVLIETNQAFHRAILEAARSPRLTALMTLALEVGMIARTYRLYATADLQRSLQHHAEIIDAIEAQAPDWAASVMSAHLMAGAVRVVRARDASEPKAGAARDDG